MFRMTHQSGLELTGSFRKFFWVIVHEARMTPRLKNFNHWSGWFDNYDLGGAASSEAGLVGLDDVTQSLLPDVIKCADQFQGIKQARATCFEFCEKKAPGHCL